MNRNYLQNANMMDDQLPVHDEMLEKSVLSTILTRQMSLAECAEYLNEDCFYNPLHKEIYQASKAIFDKGESPDMILVHKELMRRKSEIEVTFIASLCAEYSPLLDIVPHAILLRDMSLRRKLWEIGCLLKDGALDPSLAIESHQQNVIENLKNLFDFNLNKDMTLKESYSELQEHILLNMNRDFSRPFGTPTGFPELDVNGGLCPSDLIVIGAETSQGKTSFATALAMSAIENGEGVAFYSMEMSPKQLTARIASMKTGIPASKILYRQLTYDELDSIDNAIQGINLSLMHFDDSVSSSIENVMLSIRKMKAKFDISGVVVDYLQLINSSDKSINREQMIARCAQWLKNIAKELNIWILLISQLSRDKNNPTPTLSRLRDSGQIEQAADNVYFVYRPKDNARYPEPFGDVPTVGTAMIDIAKGRNIGTSKFICGFKGESTLFYPLTPDKLAQMKNNVVQTNSTTLREELPF